MLASVMDRDVVFFTGCDAKQFDLCVDLLDSLKAAFGTLPRVRVFDLGLTPFQERALKDKGIEALIVPQ